MASKEKMTGIRLSDTQNEKIRYIAEMNHRKLNDEFRYIVDKHIAEYEANHGEIIIKKNGNITVGDITQKGNNNTINIG